MNDNDHFLLMDDREIENLFTLVQKEVDKLISYQDAPAFEAIAEKWLLRNRETVRKQIVADVNGSFGADTLRPLLVPIERFIKGRMPGPGAGIVGTTKTGRPIYKASNPLNPPGVRTGVLRESIGAFIVKNSEGTPRIEVRWIPYGNLVNYGHGTRSGSRVPPRPFYSETIKNTIVNEFVRRYLKDAIKARAGEIANVALTKQQLNLWHEMQESARVKVTFDDFDPKETRELIQKFVAESMDQDVIIKKLARPVALSMGARR